jgi:hypothetical protein
MFERCKTHEVFGLFLDAASYYVACTRSLTRVEKDINICRESCFESVPMLFFWV